MRYDPIQKNLFIENRRRLATLLKPKALAVVNNNDVLPTNADGTFRKHHGEQLHREISLAGSCRWYHRTCDHRHRARHRRSNAHF